MRSLYRYAPLAALFLLAGAGAVGAADDTVGDCNPLEVDFILLEGDATLAAVEDDIRADLEKVGITVNRRILPRDEFNTAMTSGDFNLAFSESWGPPCVPTTRTPDTLPRRAQDIFCTKGRRVTLNPKGPKP